MKRAWRLLSFLCRQIGAHVKDSTHEIMLPNGSMIWARSAENPQSLDGEAVRGVIVDECTLLDEKLWTQHLRPTLSDYQGWALLIGVPKGHNWVYRMYARGLDPTRTDWASFTRPTSANPFIPAEEIAAAKDELPARVFQQEYEAAFLDDESAVFRGVRDCVANTLRDKPATHKDRYAIGVDLAKLEDFTVCTVWHTGLREMHAFERWNQISYTIQAEQIAQLAKKWNNATVYIERNSAGEPVLDMLLEKNVNALGVQTTGATKPQMIQNLILAIERQTIRFPDITVLLSELGAFAVDRLPGGGLKYGAPAGMHDDCVMSMAIGVSHIDGDYSTMPKLGKARTAW